MPQNRLCFSKSLFLNGAQEFVNLSPTGVCFKIPHRSYKDHEALLFFERCSNCIEICLPWSNSWPSDCYTFLNTLQWRHNGRDSVSNHQPHDCLLNRLFRRRSNKTSKLRVTGLCVGNSPETGEFPAQMASNADFFFPFDDVIMHATTAHYDENKIKFPLRLKIPQWNGL